MDDVAKAFQMEAYNIDDDPMEILNHCDGLIETPRLLNIKTHRLYWHAGAGCDNPDIFDRFKHEMSELGDEAVEINEKTKTLVEETWQRQLEIQ